MKIIIATGIYPPHIGGPAQYAKNLASEFEKAGHTVQVLTYGLEHKLPTGVRHFLFFIRMLLALPGTDFTVALDTFSVGLPAVAASKLLRKKIVIRIGGDFLWESYVERTKKDVLLKQFYPLPADTTLKEKCIYKLTAWTLRNATAIIFSTLWQRNIWMSGYSLIRPTYIIENFYGQKQESFVPTRKNFIWATRPLFLKNGMRLFKAFEAVKKIDPDVEFESKFLPHERLMEKISKCYAVIVPSLSEVSPNLILEAIRYNKPFIASQEMGLYESLKDIGVFINPLDTEDIVQKILMLADYGMYQTYKQKVEAYTVVHDWNAIAKEFIATIESL